MFIGYLPYLKLAFPPDGPRELQVGKARFFPDEDELWLYTLDRERLSFLRLFRGYPNRITMNEPGEPIRGTVVHSTDEEWLRRYIDEVVAITYFLLLNGSPRAIIPAPRRPIPAEVMTYYPFNLGTKEMDSWNVLFLTKHDMKWEAGDTIVLYPPLGVRGNQREWPFDIASAQHVELLRRFTSLDSHGGRRPNVTSTHGRILTAFARLMD